MKDSILTYHHYPSRKVSIGNIRIGGPEPIPVQSMTNTDTLDTLSTVEQVAALVEKGCEIVRITAPSVKEAENLHNIKNELLRRNIDIPLVADIHFTPKAAEVAARYVEKVRINPGNYIDRNRGKISWSDGEIRGARERIAERLIPLLEICQRNDTAIRIGTNHGSLSERILSIYGNTSRGMVESAMEFVRICAGHGFHNLVISMKASNVKDMVAANLLLVEQMIREDHYYPVHLGVTEAGNGRDARIKSAAGIGNLLARGIGDTIRVSLAEDPLVEVTFGRMLVQEYGRKRNAVHEILDSTRVIQLSTKKTLKEISGSNHPVVTEEPAKEAELVMKEGQISSGPFPGTKMDYSSTLLADIPGRELAQAIYSRNFGSLEGDEWIMRAAVEFSLLLHGRKTGGMLVGHDVATAEEIAAFSLDLLQGLGLRYHKAEFIACPSCGRTKFNLFASFEKVKKRTAHLKNLQIAVMGCVVNGPGEMGDADYGYVGAGPGKVTLYRHGEAALKNVDEKEAVEKLIGLIRADGDWMEP